MLNYLLVIHPVHKDAIRSVELSITINPKFHNSAPKIFQPLTCSTLSSMPQLKHLTLRLLLGENSYDRLYLFPNPNKYYTREEVLDAVANSSELIGNGLKDKEGGDGGIRSLASFRLFVTRWYSAKEVLNRDAEKWASVTEALRSVMVRT